MTKPTKPNILVLWGDDIGWWNISYNNRGQMGYRTPNIARVANEGAAFTDYYGQQSCTAGRAAFITGQNPLRHRPDIVVAREIGDSDIGNIRQRADLRGRQLDRGVRVGHEHEVVAGAVPLEHAHTDEPVQRRRLIPHDATLRARARAP